MPRLLACFLLLAVMLAPAPVTSAQETFCAPGQAPNFVFGFADLRGRLGDWMGNPVTCEFADPNGTGDVHQRTTAGLAFWRKATNTSTFTDGGQHWGLTPEGFVFWTGDSIDPPPDAVASEGNPACATPGACNFLMRQAPPIPPPAPPSPPQPPATQPVPVTAPTPPPRRDFTADCESFAENLPSRIGDKVLLKSNVVLNCQALARVDQQIGFDCYKAVLQKEIADIVIYSTEDFISRYQNCLAGRPL